MRRATVGDVEVILVEAWQRDGFDVFVTRRYPAGDREIFRLDPGEAPAWHPVPPHAPEGTVAPSLFLPGDALEALVAAGSGLKPPSSAMADHLADTIANRDRALDLVDRLVDAAIR